MLHTIVASLGSSIDVTRVQQLCVLSTCYVWRSSILSQCVREQLVNFSVPVPQPRWRVGCQRGANKVPRGGRILHVSNLVAATQQKTQQQMTGPFPVWQWVLPGD